MCIWNNNRRDKNNISNVLCSPKNKVKPVNSKSNEGRYSGFYGICKTMNDCICEHNLRRCEIIRAMWSMIEWYKILVWWLRNDNDGPKLIMITKSFVEQTLDYNTSAKNSTTGWLHRIGTGHTLCTMTYNVFWAYRPPTSIMCQDLIIRDYCVWNWNKGEQTRVETDK